MSDQPVHLVPSLSTMAALELEEIVDPDLGENLLAVVRDGVVRVEPAPPQMFKLTEVTL